MNELDVLLEMILNRYMRMAGLWKTRFSIGISI
jgi:hypothetical protein